MTWKEFAPGEWLLVLEDGDEVLEVVRRFAAEHGLRGGRFRAIGALRRGVLAYFSWETKRYEQIPVEEQVEVTALIGTLSVNQGEPAVHAHAVLGRRDGSAVTGHVEEAVVRPTLELFLRAVAEPFPRVHDEASGLDLIRF